MAQSSQARDEFKEDLQSSSPEFKEDDGANLKLKDINLFDQALGSEDVDPQPGLLSRVFDRFELDNNIKNILKEFRDSYIDSEEKFSDIGSEEWQEKLGLSRNKSIFNDQGEFQKWVLELMSNVWKEEDNNRIKRLSGNIKELIFESAYNNLHDNNGNYLAWVRQYFGKRLGRRHYRIDEAVKKFGKDSVSGYLTAALISRYCGELCEYIKVKEEKNKKFIMIVVSLIKSQLATNSAFLEEYHKILRAKFPLMLVKGEDDWNKFIGLAKSVSHLPYVDCGKFIPLLNLANSIAKFSDESSVIKKYGIRELVYLVKEFNRKQYYSDGDFSDLNNKVDKVIGHVSEIFADEDRGNQFKKYELDYPEIINSHLREIENKLSEIKDELLLEACKSCATALDKEGGDLVKKLNVIADRKTGENAEEEIEFLIKRLENLRFIIESADRETSPIRTEIVRTYLPFPNNFPQSIRGYFKGSIKTLDYWKEGSEGASYSLLLLKFANAIDSSDSKIKKWHFKSINSEAYYSHLNYLMAWPAENKRSLEKMFEQEMKSDLNVFNQIYFKAPDRTIGETVKLPEKKYEVSESKRAPKKIMFDADEIYKLYKDISSAAFKQVNARSNASAVKSQYSALIKNVVDVFGREDLTVAIKQQLEIINEVMKYLDSPEIQLDHPYHQYLLDEITAPYLEVKSILTLECLRKAASELVVGRELTIKGVEHVIQSNQATDQAFVSELYSVFLKLSQLSQRTVRKQDLLSSAGHRVYRDATVVFGKQLLGQNKNNLSPTALNTILEDVNELIEFSQFKREERSAFPFAALGRLESSVSTIPDQGNDTAALCASIGCLIGLTILAAGYYFSPMTFGASVILSKEIALAIMSVGAIMAGVCGYAVVSNSPSRLAVSLGRFLEESRSLNQRDLDLLSPPRERRLSSSSPSGAKY